LTAGCTLGAPPPRLKTADPKMAENGTPWPYGTRKKAEAPSNVWLTSEDFLALLGDWTQPLGWLLKTFPVANVDVVEMCTFGPETYGDFTASELLSFALDPSTHHDFYLKMLARYSRANWNYYCEYIPAPDPVAEPSPPPDVLPEPPPATGAPEPPTPTTTSLDELGILLSWTFRNLGDLRAIVEYNQQLLIYLCQNTQTLFYNRGLSVDVSGSGSALLSPADGYAVELTNVPPWLGHSQHGEPTYFGAGWFGYGGFPDQHARVPLALKEQLFYPAGHECVAVSWELTSGVTARITPLLRLPYPGAPERQGFSLGG
jgi:hypothetical protein